MATSAVPAALDEILELLRSAGDLNGVRIVDGPPGVNFTETDRIYVGWSSTGDQAVDIQQAFASAGARRRDEDASISCYIESRNGGTDMQKPRLRVFEILAVVEDALRATDAAPEAPTLNGTVLWSELTAGSLDQAQDQGAIAGLTFTVHTRARI
ncbi:hypothetical protein OG693_39680 (plasmid) [Streptomyces sp. NBC_01259]|uniref:hypothetical protein n=1 Tax=Streptomyces sp. NBC_01259 TaxID=2903800 RepID=UPI002F90C32F